MPDPIHEHPDLKYGAAGTYDFDNPNKWVTVPGVPLLDEHQMTNDQGKVVATVDRRVLQEIAANNNKRVRQTGDPATLILGHTSDDPSAPEKPAQGFVVNYRVAPFRRDEQGRVVYAIHGDYKIRPKKAHLVEDYPRRSVELWWHKKELDPIAMLGGSAPERDLSVIVKNARLNHIAIDTIPTQTARSRFGASFGEVLKFHMRGQATIESYSIQDRTTHADRLRRYAMNCAPGSRGGRLDYDEEFGDGDLDTTDIHDPGDSDLPDPSDDSGAGESDPLLAKVFQSKQFRDLGMKLDTVLQMVEDLASSIGGGGQMPGPGADGEMGDQGADELPPPGAGAQPGAGAMDDGAGEEGDPEDEEPEDESRRGMGERPVQMNQTGFPGAGDVAIPGFDGERRRMNRNQSHLRRVPISQPNGQPRDNQPDQRAILMERRMHDITIRYAQSEADRRVDALVAEGILFGRTPEEHAEGVSETKAHFAGLLAGAHASGRIEDGEADVDYEEQVIRRSYARKQRNPAAPAQPGVARFARDPNPREGAPGTGDEPAEDPNDFVPQDPEQATQFADLQAVHRMSRQDAVKFMRKHYPRQ